MPFTTARIINRRDKKGEVQRLFDLPPIERRAKVVPEVEAKTAQVERLREEMSLFREMFEQFLLFRLAKSASVDDTPKKVWTPRSEAPLENLHSRRPYPVQIVRGRVEFDCPACQRHTELAASQVGQKARCVLCQSAITVPRPGRSERGLNMERDVESVLHPERFQSQPTQGWSSMKRKHFRQAKILAALSSVFLLMLLNGYRKLQSGRFELLGQSMIAAKTEVPDSPLAAAEQTVREYLGADGIHAKAKFVREPERVIPLMHDYFSRHQGSTPIAWKSVDADGTGFYSDEELEHPFTNVKVETTSGENLVFTVEHTSEGPRIEWESSLGYSPQEWPVVLASGEHSAPMRVLAALDDYYNFDFTDDATQLCVRLQDPDTNELLGYGYMDRKQAAAAHLQGLLEEASPESPRPITIAVAPTDKSISTKQVRIVKVVSDGWRTDSAAMAQVP